MELWREIPSFPGYSVSNAGRVRNDEKGYLMTLLKNQQGVINVGLTRGKIQHKRSVALLVAKAFLDGPNFDTFDTPVHLDGDLSNNCIDNLVWRPRWFAVRYAQQFQENQRPLAQPLEDVSNGKIFPTSWIAAISNGLIHKDLVLATLGFNSVWPTQQRFRLIYADIY